VVPAIFGSSILKKPQGHSFMLSSGSAHLDQICYISAALIIAVGDRMFLGMHDFHFCPKLIKFYQNFTKITQILLNLFKCCPNFTHILPKLALIFLKYAKKNLLGHLQLLHHWLFCFCKDFVRLSV